MFKKKGSGYIWSFLILVLCFGVIGNFLYEENIFWAISKYEYHTDSEMLFDFDGDTNTSIYNLTLEEGHSYTFYMKVKLLFSADQNVTIDFQTAPDIHYVFQIRMGLNPFYRFEEDKFFSEVYINETQTIQIKLPIMIMDQNPFYSMDLKVYQDLPQIFLKKTIFYSTFTVIGLLIWTQAYDIMEKPFRKIGEELGEPYLSYFKSDYALNLQFRSSRRHLKYLKNLIPIIIEKVKKNQPLTNFDKEFLTVHPKRINLYKQIQNYSNPTAELVQKIIEKSLEVRKKDKKILL